MAEIMVFKKWLYLSIVVGSLPTIAETAERTFGVLPAMIVISLMIVTLLPELLLVFPGYRKEIWKGIQNNDGETNSSDLKFFISWYGPFSALRVIIFFSLFSMVQDWEPDTHLIWALVAIGTGTALPQIKSMFSR